MKDDRKLGADKSTSGPPSLLIYIWIVSHGKAENKQKEAGI